MVEDACAAAGREAHVVSSDHPVPLPEAIEAEDVAGVELVKDPEPLAGQPAHLAVPEHSHPGESKSNGLAERAVQTFEDQFRTFNAALEGNLQQQLSNSHPIMP